MKNKSFFSLLIITAFLFFQESNAQQTRSPFLEKVSFGGSVGLGFGNGYFTGTLAPSAIYHFNPYFSAGPGLNFTYIKDNAFKATIAGGSIITLFNPFPAIQLSAEFEELRVSQRFDNPEIQDQNFWNSAFFLGAGYNTGAVTFGVRYNLLFKEGDRIYNSAILPFVRVYF